MAVHNLLIINLSMFRTCHILCTVEEAYKSEIFNKESLGTSSSLKRSGIIRSSLFFPLELRWSTCNTC
jgi:hypothetical protein